jgi:SPP1 gp7 family putative phage head morphogenesis protein
MVDLFDITEWTARFEEAAKPFIRYAFSEGAGAGREDLLAMAGFEDPQATMLSAEQINAEVEKLAETFASQVVEITGRELADALKEGLAEGENMEQLFQRVGELWGIKKDSHAKLIARTEINSAANAGAVATYQEAGVTRHKWLASVDACEYCLALDGKSVIIGKSFAPLGSTVKGTEGGTFHVTYRDVKYPPLHPNDRCTIVPEIEVPK